jgi:uncharacterized protein (TIGR03545 family)
MRRHRRDRTGRGARFQLFRWRAVGPLLFFLAVFLIVWALFGERVVKTQLESALGTALGTQVDLAGLRIREADAAVDLSGLAIADPRNPRRNLLEAGAIVVDLDPAPLAEKKLVVDRLALSDLRLGTPRSRPARPADPRSPAGRLLRATEQWAREKFQFPALALGRLDTLKSLVLDPSRLATVQAAEALARRADSARTTLAGALERLQVRTLADSATALAARLARADPRKLGIAGMKDAAAAAQRTLQGIAQVRQRLGDLERTGQSTLELLEQGVNDLDAARQRDYALARGLLALPALEGPDIGGALFGKPSVEVFQRALYYAELARRHLPPGLQPWNRPGPRRARMAGTTVEFPRRNEYPRFLLRDGVVDLSFGSGQVALEVSGLSSQPALYGKPTVFRASGRLGGAAPVRLELQGVVDHAGEVPRDSVAARIEGVNLPDLALPGLPFTVHPGRSSLLLGFTLHGDRLAGRWEIGAPAARWTADTARLAGQSVVERAVWRVLEGLTELRVRAELGGTIANPSLRVSSNLDAAIAAQLRALVGREVEKAERMARQEVDRLVAEPLALVRSRVGEFQTLARERLPLEARQLGEVERRLQAELKRFAGPAGGLLDLPRLP